jgi:hypothetical protein
MESFPQGLYRVTVTMEQFIPHDPGAREDHYFLGIQGLNQNRGEDYVILIGVDGVSAGTVQVTLQGTNYSAPLVNGAAWFRSKQWPFDGVEEPYDARLRLAPPLWVNNAARVVATRPAPHALNTTSGASPFSQPRTSLCLLRTGPASA